MSTPQALTGSIAASTALKWLRAYHRESGMPDAVDLDILGRCADRYGVSLTAAMLKWLSYTDEKGKKQTATAFSWEKTDKAEELRKAAKLKK